MKLLCLYVDSYRSLNNQMLNFDSEDRFTFDLKSKKLSYKHFGGLPGDFFSTSKRKKHGHVESVSAIIGKNGSGKTSIATLMNRCMSPGKDSEIKFVFVLKNGCRYSCYHNFDDGVNDDDVKCKITDWQVINFGQMDSSPTGVDLIYYSPYFHPRPIFDIEGTFKDLSTTGLLQNMTVSQFSSNEILGIMNYMESWNSTQDRNDSGPVPCPSKILISTGRDKLVIFQKNLFNNYYYKWSNVNCCGHYGLPFKEGTLVDKGKREEFFSSHFEELIGTNSDVSQLVKERFGHYFEDAFDIGLVFDFYFTVVLQYLVNILKPLDNEGGSPMDLAYAIRLADLSYTIRERVILKFHPEMREGIREPSKEIWSNALADGVFVMELRLEYVNYLKGMLNDGLLIKGSGIQESFKRRHQDFIRFAERLLRLLPANEAIRSGDSISIDIRNDEQRKAFYAVLEDDKWGDLKFHQPRRDFEDFSISRYLTISFKGMSSGEIAYLSIFSRLDGYLKTLSRHRVHHIILYLDEAETALHPAWQQCLVDQMIKYFEHRNNLFAHIIFASHSPILLSDIPKRNVVFLKTDGESGTHVISPDDFSLSDTFAANIFDLYAQPFFLDNGTVGTFAKSKVDKALDAVGKYVRQHIMPKSYKDGAKQVSQTNNQMKDKDEAMKVLALVGDPIIQKYCAGLREGGML